MDADFACPRCSSRRHRTWSPRHPVILHWVLNPGLAFNELVLGQRIPRIMYICLDCREPLSRRTFIACPACGMFHNGMVWSAANGFAHWFGLVCPYCGKSIPCVQNLLSWALTWLTAPFWWFPAHWARPRWLAIEKRRAERALSRLSRKEHTMPGESALWDRDLDD